MIDPTALSAAVVAVIAAVSLALVNIIVALKNTQKINNVLGNGGQTTDEWRQGLGFRLDAIDARLKHLDYVDAMVHARLAAIESRMQPTRVE